MKEMQGSTKRKKTIRISIKAYKLLVKEKRFLKLHGIDRTLSEIIERMYREREALGKRMDELILENYEGIPRISIHSKAFDMP